MKKILLLCAAGMSTSMLVTKMREAAKAKDEEIHIEAMGVEKFESMLDEYDVFLLGPQIRFKKADLEKKAAEKGKPLDVINTMDYGMMKGDKVLDFALSLIK